MCHIHVHTYPTYAVRYLAYMAYIPNSVGILVFGTYLEVICEVKVAVGCVLAYMHKNVGSINNVACWLNKLYLQYAPIFVSSADVSAEHKRSHLPVAAVGIVVIAVWALC